MAKRARIALALGALFALVPFQNCGKGFSNFEVDTQSNFSSVPMPAPTPTPSIPTVPATGTIGVWTNVTPAGVDLVSSYGASTVVVDPVRPSDIYAFTNSSGVFKSTDYGLNWRKVSTGRNSNIVNGAKLWTAAIDSNTARDPATPPTLYTAAGNNAHGVLKSLDGGVNWDYYLTNNTTADPTYANDLYSLDIDPYDNQHLIGGFHGNPGLSESTNGGVTWRTVPVPGDMGGSVFPFFVRTGNAATTRSTWLTQAQEGEGAGVYRTTNGGQTWTLVGPRMYHAHGSWQIHQRNGVIYIPAYNSGGIFKSTDLGATWTNLVSNFITNTLVGTATRLYSFNTYAVSGSLDPRPMSATYNNDRSWLSFNVGTMSNGPLSAVATFDGSHYIIISGNWNAGFWRYIEP